MFEHYLTNKNEDATVTQKSKFRELNKGSVVPFDSFFFFPVWYFSSLSTCTIPLQQYLVSLQFISLWIGEALKERSASDARHMTHAGKAEPRNVTASLKASLLFSANRHEIQPSGTCARRVHLEYRISQEAYRNCKKSAQFH